MDRLKLPTVTLCAASSVNVAATLMALRACLHQIDFAQCLFFTDAVDVVGDEGICIVPVPRIESASDYSAFMLGELGNNIRTDHCLIVQWDGFVWDAQQWSADFLNYDYVGAAWPQFEDGNDVGNGGFSLRSRKLLKAIGDPEFRPEHPEDVAICRTNRALLERKHGIRFADRATADAFAFERTQAEAPTFGFHGIFNMINVIGTEGFWQVYRTLDQRYLAVLDFGTLIKQIGAGPNGFGRRAILMLDFCQAYLRRFGSAS